ncbi:MAG: TetR/AcrR family transcriptional regulator, partial [Gammaproteobacteria bacterium]|nr:TetR/AcrR family transcriptional regulator [Gammaproteobacteria bacterium]
PYLTDYMSEVLRPWVNNRAKVIREWMNAGKMIASDPVLLIFMIWASTQHYADFQAQVLGILGRKEYDDDLISQVSDFTSQTILRGCGLEPPNNEAMAHQ